MASALSDAIAAYLNAIDDAVDAEERRRIEADWEARYDQLYLDDMHDRFLNGSRHPHGRLDRGGPVALFEAVNFCAARKIVMPEWVSTAFNRGFQRVLWAEVATWDEAFGRPWPLRTDLATARKHMRIMTEIYLMVETLHEGCNGSLPQPIDNSLFEKVGKQFGLKRSQCSNLYRQEKARIAPSVRSDRRPNSR